MTSGTARPSACGQAITSTVTSRSTANGRVASEGHPGDERDRARTDGRDGQPERRTVRQRLRTRPRRLRLLDQPHDAGERRPLARARDPTRSDPAPLTVPAITRSPGVFFDRPRLAGDHRLVDRARALRDRAVGRDARAGAHQHEIARPEARRPAPPRRPSPSDP